MLNPCPSHVMNEITFLDKTTRSGVCSECVGELTRMNHELMPIHSTVQEVREVMMNLEVNMLDLLRGRSAILGENKNKQKIIEGDLSMFMADQ